MINNPDILLSAVNETFANDMTQQYYTPQTPSTYTSTCSADATETIDKDSSHRSPSQGSQ